MNPDADTPAWAIAEKAQHAAERDAALHRLAIDAEWERMWTAFVASAHHQGEFARRYARILDTGMKRLDAEREACRA